LKRIQKLVDACGRAGVKRIVYVSHTKPELESTIVYIKAKAEAEEYIRNRDDIQSYAFVRPCCIFGDTALESIVINNTAYLMRNIPTMILPKHPNKVHFQPVHVRDLAAMCVKAVFSTQNTAVDAVGPEKFTFKNFLKCMRSALKLDRWCWFIHSGLPAYPLYQLTRPINWMLNDIYVEEGDLNILLGDYACSSLTEEEAKEKGVWGKHKLSEWMVDNAEELGREYINTFERYYDVEKKRS